MIRDRSTFEKHFSRPPSQKQGDDKVIQFLRMYETQREKHEKIIHNLERQIDQLNKQVLELDNKNFALSKGLETTIKTSNPSMKKDNEISSYLDNALQEKCRELDSENKKLMVAL